VPESFDAEQGDPQDTQRNVRETKGGAS